MSDMKPIARQVEEFERSGADRAPVEAIQAWQTEQRELAASGVPANVLAIGDAFPDAELLDAHANPTSLTATRAGLPAAVVFYRGGWCPYCNIALRTYERELAGPLAELGVVMVAISGERPDNSVSGEEAAALPYAVLSDRGNRIAGSIGITMSPTPAAMKGLRGVGFELTDANADGGEALPMPTVALVEADGRLRWIDVQPNYTARTEPAEVIAAAEGIALPTNAERLSFLETFFPGPGWEDLYRRTHAPDVFVRQPGRAEPINNAEDHIADIAELVRTFPDLAVDVPHRILFESGDAVCAVSQLHGTMKGPMKLADGSVAAATGRRFETEICSVLIWRDGMIAEENLFYDPTSILLQLGIGD